MRYTISTFLIVIALILLSAPHAYASVIGKPPNNLNLVGYWSMNEGRGTNVEDFSGNGNMGTLTDGGSGLPAWTTGKLGTALAFDAVGNYVTIPNSTSLNITGAVTIAFWLKPKTVSGVHDLVTKGDGVADAVQFNVAMTGHQYYFGYCTGANGSCTSSDAINATNANLQTNTWYYIVVTYDDAANSIVLYLNGATTSGTVTAGNPKNNSIISTTNPVRIGTTYSGSETNATIDDVRIYNRVLSAAEIAAMYTSGAGGHINASSATLQNGSTLASGLVGYWTFDGGDTAWTSATVGTTQDRSGNGNTGTFTNMTRAVSSVIGKLGQAINFHYNSSVSLIKMPTASEDALDETGSMSTSFWLYVAAEPTTGDGFIVSKQADAVSLGRVTFEVDLLSNWASQTDRLYLWWSTGNNLNYSGFRSNVSYNIGKWDHWVIVRDNNAQTVTMYLNGVNVGTNDSPGNGFFASVDSTNSSSGFPAQVEMGNNDFICCGGAPFDGKIDDLRIYNRVLSAAEVKAIYNLGSVKINTSATTLTNGSTLTTGLVGHWTFDGSTVTDKVYDSSGQGHNAYYINAPTSSAKTIGKLGQALNFNKTQTSAVEAIGAGALASNSITECAWVNINAFDTNTFGTSNGSTIFSTRQTSGQTSPTLVISDKYSAGAAENPMFMDDANLNGAGDVGSTTIQLHTWYFICGTFLESGSGTYQGTWDVYVNGVRDDLNSNNYDLFGSAQLPFSGNNWFIGQTPTWPNNMDGKIDDMRIYTRVLSAAEIKQLYLIGK